MVTFTIPGAPVAKPRAKGYFNQKTGHLHHYYKNDKELKGFEQMIRLKAEEHFPKPLTGPVFLSAQFLLPRPKNMMWKTKPMPRVPCPKRPDGDNLVKTLKDALNGVAYLDDGQVTELHVWKDYHAGDEGPKTIIEIRGL